MYSPHINKAEAIRLINEIGMADVWVCITGNFEEKSIHLHSEEQEKGLALIISYVLSNPDFRNLLLKTIKNHGYEI